MTRQLWKSKWFDRNRAAMYLLFKTRKAALQHNGRKLRDGFTVAGVTKVSL